MDMSSHVAAHAVTDDVAGFNGDHSLAKAVHQVLFMGHHHHRGAQLIDLYQQAHQFQGPLRVQVSGGLIGDDGIRVVDQRAGNGHPLLLSAG